MSGEFARDLSQAADGLREIPRALADALPRLTADTIAEPLAERLRAAGTGSVYARRVASTAAAIPGNPPTVEIGGSRRVASAGATGADLLYGTEFGGGRRIGSVRASRRARAHRRRTTQQFVRQRAPFIQDTVDRAEIELADDLADRIAETIESETT